MGSAAGSIGGMAAAGRTNRTARRALGQDNISSDLLQLENLFLPYEQLVAMGRISPEGQRGWEGVGPGQSRLGRDISGLENTLAGSDPVFSQYRKLMASSLEGLNSGGLGLPSDMERSIKNELRSSQSSRGLLDSDTSAIQEVAGLLGGSEAIRSQRLFEVNNYLSGIGGSVLGSLMPNLMGLYGGELQRSMQGARNALGAAGVGVGALGASSGSDSSILGSFKAFGGGK